MHKSLYSTHSIEGYKKRPPTTKEEMQALEKDFGLWLENNRSLSYEQRNHEIVTTLTEQNFSYQKIMDLASHMLIQMDDAHLVIQRERKFEPLIAEGHKKILKDQKTRLPRKPITKDGKTIEEIIKDFVSSAANTKKPTIKLWGLFYDELTRLNFKKLQEVNHKKEADKCFYKFLIFNGKQDQVKFGRFKNIVAKHRHKKKSH